MERRRGFPAQLSGAVARVLARSVNYGDLKADQTECEVEYRLNLVTLAFGTVASRVGWGDIGAMKLKSIVSIKGSNSRKERKA